MRPSARVTAALAIALFAAPVLLALHFRDGPPARVTGGFGEDSCAACHFGNALNESAGKLTLAGFPERFKPGRTYALELKLERPGMKAAGFQLAIRQAGDKTQAGRIEVAKADEASIALLEERGVQFAHQREPAVPSADGSAVRWRLSWTAPKSDGPATLHVAAVAGDGDESQAGDYVYTLGRVADFVASAEASSAATRGPPQSKSVAPSEPVANCGKGTFVSGEMRRFPSLTSGAMRRHPSFFCKRIASTGA